MYAEHLPVPAVRPRGVTVAGVLQRLVSWAPLGRSTQTAPSDCDDSYVPVVTMARSREFVRGRVIEERQGVPLEYPDSWFAD
jgi:hypothetical protein